MLDAYHYAAYGLKLSSDLRLPELASSPAPKKGAVRIAQDPTLTLSSSPQEFSRVDPSGFHLGWGQVGSFLVTPEGNIFYRRVPGASDELIRVPLLGAVLASALFFRGMLVMHGNTVAVGGRGVLLVGAKGQGKSTLSAALVQRGHFVHAEDASTVAFPADAGPVVLPGTRQLRLWRDSMEQLFGGLPSGARQIHELSEKLVLGLPDLPREASERLPLARVYVLEDHPGEAALLPLSAAEAWPRALAHSLVSRFGSTLLAGGRGARHFASCAALAKSVPCLRLQRPRDFSRLGEVIALIERDLASA